MKPLIILALAALSNALVRSGISARRDGRAPWRDRESLQRQLFVLEVR
jgi:hypothetical protein